MYHTPHPTDEKLRTFGTKKGGNENAGMRRKCRKDIAIYVHNTLGRGKKRHQRTKNPHKQKMAKQQEAKSICPFEKHQGALVWNSSRSSLKTVLFERSKLIVSCHAVQMLLHMPPVELQSLTALDAGGKVFLGESKESEKRTKAHVQRSPHLFVSGRASPPGL